MNIDFSQSGKSIANFAVDTSSKSQTDKTKANVESEANPIIQTNAKVIAGEADVSVQKDKSVSVDDFKAALEKMSQFATTTNRQLNFSIDEDSSKQVVKVTDAESGEVIRQIPSEEILKLSERLQDLQSDLGASVGIFFNKQV